MSDGLSCAKITFYLFMGILLMAVMGLLVLVFVTNLP